MAFTSLAGLLARKPRAFAAQALIRCCTLAASAMLAWGAWQQVVVGLDSHSVVLGYPRPCCRCRPCCARWPSA
jgi:gluconokinase